MASAMDRRFEIASNQLKKNESQTKQQEKEALQRRFASMGGLGSGASIKTEQMAEQASGKRLAEGMGNIEMSKLAEQARQEEIAQQQAYGTSERQAGQAYGTSERQAGQAFGTSERMAGQAYGSMERKAGQAYGTSERQAGQAFAGDQAAMARLYGTTEREAGQAFASGQNQAARDFATSERIGGQEFQSGQATAGAQLATKLQESKNALEQQGINLAAREADVNELLSAFNTKNKVLYDALFEKLYPGMNQAAALAAAESEKGKLVYSGAGPR